MPIAPTVIGVLVSEEGILHLTVVAGEAGSLKSAKAPITLYDEKSYIEAFEKCVAELDTMAAPIEPATAPENPPVEPVEAPAETPAEVAPTTEPEATPETAEATAH